MRIWLLIACNWVVERMWIIIVCALVSLFNNEHFVITQFSLLPFFPHRPHGTTSNRYRNFLLAQLFSLPAMKQSSREWMEKNIKFQFALSSERFFFQRWRARKPYPARASGENENLRKSFGSWKIQLFFSPLRLSLIHVCAHYFFLFLGKIKFKSLKMHEMSSTLFPHIYTENPAQHSRMLIFSVGNRQNERIWESQKLLTKQLKVSLTFSGFTIHVENSPHFNCSKLK